jgi:hypothetical protein
MFEENSRIRTKEAAKYSTPVLIVFGSMIDLTAAGSNNPNTEPQGTFDWGNGQSGDYCDPRSPWANTAGCTVWARP